MSEPVGSAASADATAQVFSSDLHDSLTLGGDDGHHLARVRRVRPGERVTAADGAGHWRTYEVTGAAGGELVLAAVGPLTLEPQGVPLTVAPALITRSRFDDAIVSLVELGVDTIVPLAAERCVVQWGTAKVPGALDRLRRLAREAAMQCRRARLPTIEAPCRPAALAARPGLVVAAADGVGIDELDPAPASGFVLLTGPEGGFAPGELDALGPHGALCLGPHVLRAETAAVAGAAVLRSATLRAHRA